LHFWSFFTFCEEKKFWDPPPPLRKATIDLTNIKAWVSIDSA
jgi:hypothetical protein